MGVLLSLAPADLRRVVSTYRDALRNHQEELNRLNVYPVPDGDTGTNMALTLESVVGELPGDGSNMEQVCEAIRHGSLMGARGNSGVILSQILRGLADTFSPLESISAPDVVAGLRRAADAAYEAVLRPVEGTILTVVRLAAEAVEQASANGEATLNDVLERAANAARAAVASTPDLLPVLRDAGVVDAGGPRLRAAARRVPQRRVRAPGAGAGDRVDAGRGRRAPPRRRWRRRHLRAALRGDVLPPRRRRHDPAVQGARGAISATRSSSWAATASGTATCTRTTSAPPSRRASSPVGPSEIRVTDLHEQVEEREEEAWVREQTDGRRSRAPVEHVATGVVAVAVGAGLEQLFASLGVQHIVAGGQSMNPSTAQILEAVQQCAADGVIVLPNNKNIVPVARQVPELADRPVTVVPTAAVVEALAALVVYDADASIEENTAAMDEAAARVRAGEVTQAVRDSSRRVRAHRRRRLDRVRRATASASPRSRRPTPRSRCSTS